MLDNVKDCGITLASNNPKAAKDPSKVGVYENVIASNRSSRNGAIGVGVFAGAPGGAAWGNTAADNILTGNKGPGVALHENAPGQDLSGNVVIGNTIARNGPDEFTNGKGTGDSSGVEHARRRLTDPERGRGQQPHQEPVLRHLLGGREPDRRREHERLTHVHTNVAP